MSRDPKLLHPILQKKLSQMQAEGVRHGMDILMTDGYRTDAEQNALYEQGRTMVSRLRGEKVVTNAKAGESYHNYGVAFDVVPVVDGKAVWGNEAYWRKIGEIGKKLGLEWGGDWSQFPDKPHFQYTQGITLAEFKAGKHLATANDRVADWAKDSWKKAKEKGVVSANSVPTEPLTKQELMVFLDRLGLLDIQ